jgi:hypothetical protein
MKLKILVKVVLVRNLPAFAFAVQMLPDHLVCGFVGISGRDEPRVLLFATATGAKLDLVYVYHTHDASLAVIRPRSVKAIGKSRECALQCQPSRTSSCLPRFAQALARL